MWIKVFCIGCKWVLVLVCIGLDWFGGVFVKREMFGFQRKCCQKFIKTPVLVLAIGYVIIIQMK